MRNVRQFRSMIVSLKHSTNFYFLMSTLGSLPFLGPNIAQLHLMLELGVGWW